MVDNEAYKLNGRPEAGTRMLDQPLSDKQGNKLHVMQAMPGLGVCITATSSDGRVVQFNADADALRSLAAVIVSAAEVAERVARR